MDRSSKKRKLDFDCSDGTFRSAFLKAVQLPFPVDKILPDSIRNRLEPLATFHSTTMCMLLAGLLPAISVVMSNAKVQVRRKLQNLSLFCIVGAKPQSGKSTAFGVAVQQTMNAISEHLQIDLLLKDYTRSAFLQHLSATGAALIGSDEISSILQQVLSRSDQGVGATGERQLLCTLYTGGSFEAKYAQKDNISIDAGSNICIAGYTQPDKLKGILQQLTSSDDGLLDRFMIWLSGGQPYFVDEEEAAYELITKQGGGFDLPSIVVEIANLHNIETIYRFDKDAEELLTGIHNELVRRQRPGERPNEIYPIVPYCASLQFQKRYEEHLIRIAVILHVLFQVMTHKIKNTVCAQIPEEITFEVLNRSKELLDFIAMQKEMLLEALIDGREHEIMSLEMPADTDDNMVGTSANNDMLKLAKKIVLMPGKVLTNRLIQRSCNRINVSEVTCCLKYLVMHELGSLNENPRAFYKNPKPSDAKLLLLDLSRSAFNKSFHATTTTTVPAEIIQASPYSSVATLAVEIVSYTKF